MISENICRKRYLTHFSEDVPAHSYMRAQSTQSAKLFLQSSELGLPQPLTPRQVCPPPLPRFWREGHTRWRERGWGSPNSDEGTYTVVLFTYTYFVHEREFKFFSRCHDSLPVLIILWWQPLSLCNWQTLIFSHFCKRFRIFFAKLWQIIDYSHK
jgi:hypothetical protein